MPVYEKVHLFVNGGTHVWEKNYFNTIKQN